MSIDLTRSPGDNPDDDCSILFDARDPRGILGLRYNL